MKKFLLLMATIALFCSCHKNNVPTEEFQEPYLGMWKLMELSFYDFLHFQLTGEHYPILDYSNHNVIYEFKENGILVVSGDMDHPLMSWFAERGLDVFSSPYVLTEGTYSYLIAKSGESYSTPECYICINKKMDYGFRILEALSPMEMGFSITGGCGFSLVKIK